MSAPSTPDRRRRTGVCNLFLSGNCKKGERCNYKHEGGGTPGPSTPSGSRKTRGGRGQGRGGGNAQPNRGGALAASSSGPPVASSSGPRVSELSVRPSRPTQKGDGWKRYGDWEKRFGGMKQSASQMRHFWEEALDIVEGLDPNLIQKIVGRLVAKDNAGRQLIEQVVKNDYPGPPVLDYLVVSVPLLLLLTHPELINSIAIDRQVGTIYNYLYGTDGSICVTFFRNLATQLEKETAVDARKSGVWKSAHLGKPASFSKVLASIVEGLRHTLKRNIQAGFNEDYKTVAESYCVLAGHVAQSDEFHTSINSSLTEIIGIHRRANLIVVLPTPAPTPQGKGKGAIVSSFPLEIDYPGYLSTKGRRHDNDSVSILEISILPTLEEILSQRKEYLPYKDLSHPHFLSGVDRLFDTHFRLLRHDSVAGLRGSVSMVFDLLQLPPQERAAAVKKATRRSIDGNLYDDASVVFANFDRRQGLELVLRFQQPSAVIRKTPNEQRKWWESQKSRFERGTLACFVTKGPEDFRRAIFFTISRKDIEASKYGLATGTYGHICVQLACSIQEGEDTDLDFILGRLSRFAVPMTSVLIEFPKIIPATFLPVLNNLQKLSQRGTLSLSHWIAPSPEGRLIGLPSSTPENLPPAYSRSPAFRWDLKPILKDQSRDLFLSSTTLSDDPQALKLVEQMTTLDGWQCKALLTGLVREMSLIQGPPGTGKSYVGVEIVTVLLHNKIQSKIGPIVCVCYTNHALDQFLEDLLDRGIKKIIRVGGQSKSDRIAGFNLQNVSRAIEKTRNERSSVYEHNRELDSISEEAQAVCKKISRRPDSWEAISEILQGEFPELYDQLLMNEADPYIQAQEQEWTERFEEEVEESRLKGENMGMDPDIENPWVEVSKPTDIWDAWRGVRRGPVWEHRNRNITNSPYPPRTLEAIVDCRDIWSLPWDERHRLVAYLSRRAAESPIRLLSNLAQGHAVEAEELNAQYREVDRRCLEEADVIGITTTGLARQVELLSRLDSKVVVCEEAGEVLEGHLINTILPTCQHLIQIGDHEQLRPQINNFDLSLESRNGAVYSLDESMFERLVREKPELAPAQLNTQRRMRPAISSLIKNTLYPHLRDFESVSKYPDVVGMRKNVFWLDHTRPEAGGDASGQVTSHSNDWEVQMTHGLVRHLVRQSHYATRDIAVLTPYIGQLQKLRRVLGSSFEVVLSEKDEEALVREGLDEGNEPALEPEQVSRNIAVKKSNLLDAIRVATVDNFQGEEAKVVIISLVRSNDERKVGFLRTTNRINVLLSRAKHGMYLIGNAECAASIPMWRDVCQMLRDTESIGTQLALVCPRHQETPIQIEEPQDFLRLSPEGGCDLPCDKRLGRCGHRCFSKCHSDGMHRAVSCAQPCNKLHEACQHICQRLCSEDCGPCKTLVYNFKIPCGHVEERIECWRTLKPQDIICRKSVTKTIPRCGHSVKVPCCVDVKSTNYKCPTECTHLFPCSHKCKGRCGSCKTVVGEIVVTNHGRCTKVCGRGFTSCNHRCRSVCHDGSACSLCDAQCDVKCEHSKCAMKCQESCAPCAEPCAWKCKHQGQCQMPCAAPCELLPCDERCDKMLKCGHRCPSLCGEICPAVDFCQLCCSAERKEDPGVDMIEFSPYGSIDLDENPILVLSCGHFFTRETLDGYLQLHSAYSTDTQGRYVGYVDPEGSLDEQTPKCPSCRQPLLQYSVRRYGRVINRAAIMEMTRRYLASASSRHKALSKAVVELESDLVKSRDKFHATLSSQEALNTHTKKQAELKERLDTIEEVSKRLSEFLKTTNKQQQPIMQLYQSTVTRKALNTSEKKIQATLYFRPDTRLGLLAKILSCRSNLLIITENALLAHHLRSKAKNSQMNNTEVFIDSVSQSALKKAKASLKSCRTMIDTARAESLPGAEVDAIGIFSKIVAIWRQLPQDPTSSVKLNEAVKEATSYLDEADKVCRGDFTGVKNMKQMLKVVRRQLNGGTFYQDISEQEMAGVVRAMQAELTAGWFTGRWYYCQNGHPFTVGECGRPMQEVKCPECNAPVGGTNHNPAGGVQSAAALDAMARRV